MLSVLKKRGKYSVSNKSRAWGWNEGICMNPNVRMFKTGQSSQLLHNELEALLITRERERERERDASNLDGF